MNNNMHSLLRATALSGLLLLSACSSLPTIDPDMARRAPPKVKMEGAQGIVSAERSKAIIDKLQGSGEPTDIFDIHLALEESILGSPLTIDNNVTLLQDG